MPKKTVKAIIDTENNYLIGVKMNQKTLCEHIRSTTEDMLAISSRFSEWEYSKGRTERREVLVSHCLGKMGKHWAGLKQVIKIKRTVKDKGETREENAYYIGSQTVNAQVLCRGIRSHWSIENGLHWVKDVSFNEDASRIRTANAPQNVSIFRNIAINLFRTNNYTNMAQAQRLCANDIKKLKELIT